LPQPPSEKRSIVLVALTAVRRAIRAADVTTFLKEDMFLGCVGWISLFDIKVRDDC
jgi:hypothetical protein